MAAKTSQERLDQTIKFIKREGPHGRKKADWDVVIEALEDWYGNVGAQADRPVVSGLMSFDQDKTGKRNSKSDRHYIRAAILLRCVFRHPINPRPFKAIADEERRRTNSARSIFENALSDIYDSAASMPLHGQKVIDELLRDPQTFMQANVLVPMCGNQGGQHWFSFNKSTEKWKIDVQQLQPAGRASLQAFVVPPTLFSEVGGDGSLVGSRSDDSPACKVMLTTQFTGCSFCFSINGQSLVAAHVDPGGGVGRDSTTTGEEVRTAMVKHTKFRNHNGGVFKVYGRRALSTDGFGYGRNRDSSGRTGSKQMVIVGLWRDGAWQLWSQQLFMDNATVVQRIDNLPGFNSA